MESGIAGKGSMSVPNGDHYGSQYQQAHVCTVTAGDLFWRAAYSL